MQAVILAGGLGTRMWPAARDVPKTMLPVAGRPFTDWQLEWLGRSGVSSVVYCIGYHGDLIRAHVGDGSAFRLDVTYVDEGTRLRGTAGALRLAFDQGILDERFVVLYGDSWLTVDVADVHRTSVGSGLPALMTVFENEGRWDASNVVLEGDMVTRYAKGLRPTPPEMRWIDYGLSVLTRNLIADRVPRGEVADLAPIYSALADEGQLAAYVASERFFEIGSPEGLRETERMLLGR